MRCRICDFRRDDRIPRSRLPDTRGRPRRRSRIASAADIRHQRRLRALGAVPASRIRFQPLLRPELAWWLCVRIRGSLNHPHLFASGSAGPHRRCWSTHADHDLLFGSVSCALLPTLDSCCAAPARQESPALGRIFVARARRPWAVPPRLDPLDSPRARRLRAAPPIRTLVAASSRTHRFEALVEMPLERRTPAVATRPRLRSACRRRLLSAPRLSRPIPVNKFSRAFESNTRKSEQSVMLDGHGTTTPTPVEAALTRRSSNVAEVSFPAQIQIASNRDPMPAGQLLAFPMSTNPDRSSWRLGRQMARRWWPAEPFDLERGIGELVDWAVACSCQRATLPLGGASRSTRRPGSPIVIRALRRAKLPAIRLPSCFIPFWALAPFRTRPGELRRPRSQPLTARGKTPRLRDAGASGAPADLEPSPAASSGNCPKAAKTLRKTDTFVFRDPPPARRPRTRFRR